MVVGDVFSARCIEKPKHVVCLINKLDKPIQADVIVLCLIEYYPHNNSYTHTAGMNKLKKNRSNVF
jgi:hypothetical protein